MADGVDVIIPVATTAAQLMTVAAEGTGIPVVYAAVSDPEQADLLDLDYVTGMSDALNTPVHPGHDAGPGPGGADCGPALLPV